MRYWCEGASSTQPPFLIDVKLRENCIRYLRHVGERHEMVCSRHHNPHGARQLFMQAVYQALHGVGAVVASQD